MSNALSVTARLSAPWLHVSQAQSSVALATPHSHTAPSPGQGSEKKNHFKLTGQIEQPWPLGLSHSVSGYWPGSAAAAAGPQGMGEI
jgi:hypothetical protein